MKAVVNDKKHLTLVSHTNGVVIVEESGCIIDLDFQSLGSIFELADLGNTYTINTLLNCSNISVYDIMDKFKDDITYSNTH